MKMQQNPGTGINLITAYGADGFFINGVEYRCELAVSPDAVKENWVPSSPAAVAAEDLASLLELGPALVLLGTGSRQQFPAPSVLRPLIEAGVACEVMDSGAACRTYNILASEGRRVVAALLRPVGV